MLFVVGLIIGTLLYPLFAAFMDGLLFDKRRRMGTHLSQKPRYWDGEF